MATCRYTFQTAQGEQTITGMENMKAFLALNGIGAIASGLPLFRRGLSIPASPALIDAINTRVSRITAGWKNAPQLIVVRDMDDPKIPETVRLENERQLSQGSSGSPAGFYLAGKVYFVASEVKSADDVDRVLFHESLGHFGLRGFYGADLSKVLDQVAVLRKKDVLAKAKQYGLDPNTEKDLRIAAEEVLAEMAQTAPETSLVKRAIAAIRKWLRDNVPYFANLELSDNDIIQNYLLPAREFVMRGGKEQDVSELVGAFSRGDIKGLKAKAIAYARENFAGKTYTNKSDGNPILVSNQGIKHAMSGRDTELNIIALTKLDKLIEESKFVRSEEDKLNRNTIKEVRFYQVTAQLGNEKSQLEIVVRVAQDGNRYYDHIEIKNPAGQSGKLDKQDSLQPFTGLVSLDDAFIINSTSDNVNIPETINVNGIDRPTRNSSGKYIYPTLEGIENFWQWFGDSKVTDAEGRPLAVYHGTKYDFYTFDKSKDKLNRGFWFSTASVANRFAMAERGKESGDNVMPVYLAIQNPYVYDANAIDKPKNLSAIFDEAKKGGYDGVYMKSASGNADTYVTFESNQIKSATGNNGNFYGNNDSVLFSRQSPLNQEWETLEDSGRLKNLQYTFQDKYVDLKDVVSAVKKTGRQIVDSLNAYLQEELYHGRVAKRIQDFTKQELEPLLSNMQTLGVTMPDFEMYLWARHAPERNAQIAKINPGNAELQDGGSGMTTAEADAYIAALAPDVKANMEQLAAMIDAINKRSRNILMAYGLEDMDTTAKMEQAYQYYVPLMRDIGGNVEGGYGTGQGFSIKGNSTKRAMGSTKPVVDILANIAAQREKFIVRGEKNRVATALVGLAITNPKDGFWSVDNPPKLRYVDKATGIVEETVDPNYKSRNNVVVARFLNQQGRVVERAVVFNEKDQRALRLAESIKNLDVDGIEDWMRSIGGITRYFASVNTQYNPIFGIVNIVRDVQGAMINLGSTPLAGKQKEVMGGVFPAMAGVWQSLRAERNGQQPSGNWVRLWEEYQREGGQTGYRELFAKASDRTKKLNKTIDPDWWKKTKFGRLLTYQNAHVLAAEKWLVDKANQWIFENLSDYNQTLENAVRLSAYKAALDAGLSKQQAASLGKNLTVNFNRKGSWGARMGAVYAFFNASAQGTARIAQTLFKDGKLTRTGKIVIQGGVLLGIAQALALAAAGFGDDDPPEFERDSNLILPIGEGKYVKLAMPIGYHIIPATARKITEFLMGKNQSPADLIASLGALYADGLNPLGGGGSLLQTASFTVTDPIVSLAMNKDGLGRRIYQEKFSQSDTTAGYLRARDTANALSKAVAYAINLATGGSDYTEGVLSPTPDQISFLAEQIGGGVAREIMKSGDVASSITTGTALPTYRIPLVGRFYGDAKSKTSHAHEFYSNIQLMDKHKREIKGRLADGLDTADYVKKHPEAILWRQAQLTARTVANLRKRRESLIAQGSPKQDIETVETLIAQKEERFNQLVKETEKQP